MQADHAVRSSRFLARYLVPLALAAIAAGLTSAHAATIVVTNANDSGPGSLRQAVLDSAAGGLIVFDPSLSGATIRLASTLTIDRGLTIDGSTLVSRPILSGDSDGNGAGNVQVLFINAVDPVTLKNLVITRGYSLSSFGGGLANSGGNVSVVNSQITNNSAPKGGGVLNVAGTISFTKSTISGNEARGVTSGLGGGGGILILSGGVALRDSTVSGNTALSFGAADNYGGGIYNDGGLSLYNSSVVGNFANGWGGAIYNAGNVTAVNSTIVYNEADVDDNQAGKGAGIASFGTVTIRSTLLAGNAVRSIPIYDDCYGTIESNGVNIIRAQGTTVSGTCTITGSTLWTPLNSLALLGGLQNNGGPTQTVALLPGSNAINGDSFLFGCLDLSASVVGVDQRGVLRPKGFTCDIGAFEYADPADPDGDGVDSALDNCTALANASQCDTDGDGYGNRCDGDLNNNGSVNAQDTTLFRQRLGQPSAAPAYNVADLNCSGNVNAQDTVLYRALLGSPPGPSGQVP